MSTHLRITDTKMLEDYCATIFSGFGLPENDAKIVAASLVDADLRGVTTHGVMRVKNYVERITNGGVNLKPHIETVRETPTTVLIDGDNCFGSVVSDKLVRIVREKAKKQAIAFGAARRSNHYGAAAYWSLRLSGEDLIGITGSNVEPLISVAGSKVRGIGNNPFSYAFPTGRHGHICLDVACSVLAGGKRYEYQILGKPLPEGAFRDADGVPTTDPFKANILMPFAGHKGYGIAVVVEMLTSILAGGNFGTNMGSQYNKLGSPNHISHYFAAIDITAFRELDDYKADADRYVEYLHSLPREEGVEQILFPGQLEQERKQCNLDEGLMVPVDIIDQLLEYGKAVGIPEGKSFFLKTEVANI